MTSFQNLVCDNSSTANFKAWGSAISAFMSTAGWTQASDTGQVNWSTISSVPTNNNGVFEIWEPNDGMSNNFYLKILYRSSNNGAPNIGIQLGTATNGSGTLSTLYTTEFETGPYSNENYGSTQYACYFSGAPGRMGVMMWQNSPNNTSGNINAMGQFFAVERSINSAGSYTNAHVTMYLGPQAGETGNTPEAVQQSLVFGVGPSLATSNNSGGRSNGSSYGGWCVRVGAFHSMATTAFNGSIPMDTVAPVIGVIDCNCTVVGVAYAPDVVEAVTFTASLYGTTHTYLPSKNFPFSWCGPAQGGGQGNVQCALCMRYD